MDIFSHLFAVKIVMFVWKDKINIKEAGDCPFFLMGAYGGDRLSICQVGIEEAFAKKSSFVSNQVLTKRRFGCQMQERKKNCFDDIFCSYLKSIIILNIEKAFKKPLWQYLILFYSVNCFNMFHKNWEAVDLNPDPLLSSVDCATPTAWSLSNLPRAGCLKSKNLR